MSVQIVIDEGGVFQPATINQRDLVFWYNKDDQAHYPVPGCSKIPPDGASLEVPPGDTTPKYQPAPSPNLPVTITYGCAIAGHESESGTITVNADSGQPATGTPAGPDSKTIAISAGGVFATVDVHQSDTVAWQNDDSKTHYPVPNCTGLLVQSQGVSNQLQPEAPWGLPMAITYGCAMPGHGSESGTINVYADFVAAASPIALSASANTAAIATGGKSPYKLVNDPNYPFLTLQEAPPAGSSAGVNIVLGSSQGTAQINYQLNVTDALGTNINTAIQINLS